MVTVGGFSHPMPVLVLEALGCDKIVMVNRPEGDDEINSFRYNLNRMLGASEEQLALKYDVANPESTVAQALQRLDGTVCAKWDDPGFLDLLGITQSGIAAPFYSSDACLLSLSETVVVGAERGCTPEPTTNSG
jgi:hypothetical protein